MKRIFSASIAALYACVAPAAAGDDDATPTSSPHEAFGDAFPVIATVKVRQKAPAPVKAAQHLRAGAILHASDLVAEDDDASALVPFVGMELKRAVYAGKIVTQNDIRPPTLIERNAIVTLEFERGPLLISTEGRALDAGARGEAVRVMNLASKIILTAEVVGPNKVKTK